MTIIRNRATVQPTACGGLRVINRIDAGKGEAELLLFDVIGADPWTGGGITAKSVAEALDGLKGVGKLTVRISSPGGLVSDGLAIHDMLARFSTHVVTQVEGLAASAASFIAMAGRERVATPNSMIMIHLAHGLTLGNADDHEKTARTLRKHDEAIAGIYAKRAGRRVQVFLDAMKAETWYNTNEAIRAGLLDATVAATDAVAATVRWCPKVLARYTRTPDAVRYSRQAVTARVRELEAKAVRDRLEELDRHEQEDFTCFRRAVATRLRQMGPALASRYL